MGGVAVGAMTRLLVALFLSLSLPVAVLAQPEDPPPPPPPAGPVSPFGLGWGIGMGFSANLVGRQIVEPGGAFVDASNTVRVTDPSTARSRVLAEAHFTWRVSESIAVGPVMFLQPSDADLFDAAGGGVVVELGSGARSMNIVIGALLDFNVSQLHPAYVDGFPSPTDDLLFVRREQLQLLLGFVVGF